MKKKTAGKTIFEEIQGTSDEIIAQVKKLVKKGNARRVMILNKKGKVLFQSHLTAGMAGTAVIAVLSPVIAAIGFFAVVLSDMKVVVEKYPEDELGEDKYEVKAEVIEIEDDDEPEEGGSDKDKSDDDKTEKTVGKDEK